MRAPARLIVTTGVVIVVVVTLMLALVVVCAQFLTRLVAQIGMALFLQVLGMLAVDATGLEVLVFALGGTLPVVAFVVTTTVVIAELVLLALAMMTRMVAAVVSIVQPVAPMVVVDKGIPYAHIVPPACGITPTLPPPESF
jgi:hypothetical protein